MSFIAPSSAHPVGPHSGEEGQVVAIGLCQEHGLPGVQGETGTGVSLLGHSRVAKSVTEGPPGTLLLVASPAPSLGSACDHKSTGI